MLRVKLHLGASPKPRHTFTLQVHVEYTNIQQQQLQHWARNTVELLYFRRTQTSRNTAVGRFFFYICFTWKQTKKNKKKQTRNRMLESQRNSCQQIWLWVFLSSAFMYTLKCVCACMWLQLDRMSVKGDQLGSWMTERGRWGETNWQVTKHHCTTHQLIAHRQTQTH